MPRPLAVFGLTIILALVVALLVTAAVLATQWPKGSNSAAILSVTVTPVPRAAATTTPRPKATARPTAKPPKAMATPTSTPTATPTAAPTPSPTPTPRPLTLVVFLQGLNSSIVDGRSKTPLFDKVKAAITEKLPHSVLLDYSYVGVKTADAGRDPRPLDYARCDTQQDLDLSVAHLRAELGVYTAFYQGQGYDVHIALIGHSLGGLTAALGMSEPRVDRVITLDSPLMGIGSGKAAIKSLWDSFGCATGNEDVLADLSAIQADATWRAAMERRVTEFQARGGRIATLGNRDDCLYDPLSCPILCFTLFFIFCPFFVDETSTQVIENADSATLCDLGNAYASGHAAILFNPNTARYIASFVSGSQPVNSTPAVC